MRKILALLMLIAFCLPSAAQQKDLVLAFQDAAGAQTALLRGEQAERYAFPANGNPYWESPVYLTGDIDVDGRQYYGVPVNFDAVAQQALVQAPGGQFSVSLSPARVGTFTSGDRTFVGIGPGGQLPEGFYEVFGKGNVKVFKSVRKHLSTSTSNVNGAAIGYKDENYREDLTRYFSIKTTYYFKDADGSFSRLHGKGSLLSKFKNKKDIKASLRKSGKDGLWTDFEEYCKAVLGFAD